MSEHASVSTYRGLRVCYAKVFANCMQSQHGLSKLGSAPLALPIDAGREAEKLYRRGYKTPSTVDIANEARRLFAVMSSSIRVLYLILSDESFDMSSADRPVKIERQMAASLVADSVTNFPVLKLLAATIHQGA